LIPNTSYLVVALLLIYYISIVAKVVAYAGCNEEAEYFTVNYLRPILEKTEKLLDNNKEIK